MLRVPHVSHLQSQSHPSACKGWILAWVQPQGQISWAPVAGRRRCSRCPKTGSSPSWPLPAPSGGYCSLGSTCFCGKTVRLDYCVQSSCNFHFGIICKLHRCDVLKKSIPQKKKKLWWEVRCYFSWILWNIKGNQMKDVMQIRLLVDRNIRELPQCKMTRSAAVNETKAAVKVTNKSKSNRAVTTAEIKRWGFSTELWIQLYLKSGALIIREEHACKMMLFLFIIILVYHFSNLHFKEKTYEWQYEWFSGLDTVTVKSKV